MVKDSGQIKRKYVFSFKSFEITSIIAIAGLFISYHRDRKETIEEIILTLKGLRCFFVMLGTKGGHFDPPPPANSETKEAMTMKLCTVMAYYNTGITKEFLNSHCSIVWLLFCLFLTVKSVEKNDQSFKFFQIK